MAAGDPEYADSPWGCWLSPQRWALTTAPESRSSVEQALGTIGEGASAKSRSGASDFFRPGPLPEPEPLSCRMSQQAPLSCLHLSLFLKPLLTMPWALTLWRACGVRTGRSGLMSGGREETGVPRGSWTPKHSTPLPPWRSLQLAAEAESTYGVAPAKYRLSHRPTLLSNVMTVNHHLKTSMLLTKLQQGR